MAFNYLLLFCFASCGTETGNPQKPTTRTSSGTSENMEFKNIANFLCTKLKPCKPILVMHDCLIEIVKQDKFDIAFGIGVGLYSSLQEILNAHNSGELELQQEIFQECMNEVDQLACDDSEILNAYNEERPDDFSKLYKIIPKAGRCSSVFRGSTP